jgi:hypothetical protein
MSILGPSSTDNLEQQALNEIRAAGRNDWRASAWLLQHHPTTRMRYHDIARTMADRSQIMDRVMKAAADAGLSAETRYQFVLALQAIGLPCIDEEVEQIDDDAFFLGGRGAEP